MQDWLFLIPLFPLVGFAINGAFGARLSRPTVSIIASVAISSVGCELDHLWP